LFAVGLEDELTALDERIDARSTELVRIQAELAGLKAQRNALDRAMRDAADRDEAAARVASGAVTDLRGVDRTEAIEHVLRAGKRLMSITDVWEALRAAGRPEPDRQVVASTLNFLHRRGRISKPRRGFYAT
jgi:septal ring factor EnvC (AmiA/AmiB activator)